MLYIEKEVWGLNVSKSLFRLGNSSQGEVRSTGSQQTLRKHVVCALLLRTFFLLCFTTQGRGEGYLKIPVPRLLPGPIKSLISGDGFVFVFALTPQVTPKRCRVQNHHSREKTNGLEIK